MDCKDAVHPGQTEDLADGFVQAGQFQAMIWRKDFHHGDNGAKPAGIDEFHTGQIQNNTPIEVVRQASHLVFESHGIGGIDSVILHGDDPDVAGVFRYEMHVQSSFGEALALNPMRKKARAQLLPFGNSNEAIRRQRVGMTSLRVDYPELIQRVEAVAHGEDDAIALMATVACEVHHSDDRFDWTGFYRVVGPELLKIGPYQGGHGCLVIPFNKGVCGAAARTGEVQLVPDVDAFPGHIACASSTRSELVLPVTNATGELIAVFDLDSDQPDAFTTEDADGMSRLLRVVFAGEGV